MPIYDRRGILARDSQRKREPKKVGYQRPAPAAPAPDKKKAAPAKSKPRKAIKKKGKKTAAAERKHGPIKKEMLAAQPFCRCGSPVCRQEATVDVHHLEGRGANLNDRDKLIAMARRCHDWVKENSEEAMRIGLLLPRTTGPAKKR